MAGVFIQRREDKTQVPAHRKGNVKRLRVVKETSESQRKKSQEKTYF